MALKLQFNKMSYIYCWFYCRFYIRFCMCKCYSFSDNYIKKL
nr:MAG TPA: hypothetical protein [Caudoviricetes sp.]DAK73096.1 MAG TPA: hypothetical protein [Caudoviricetes sp.]